MTDISMVSLPPMVIIAGVTGSGKTKVANRLVKENPERFVRSVSCTTRLPRINSETMRMEVNGVDYWFISNEEFEELDRADGFIERSPKTRSVHYGTGKQLTANLISQGKTVIFVIEFNGLMAIKKFCPAAVVIWLDIAPCVMEKRLSGQAASVADQTKRVNDAVEELAWINNPANEREYRVTRIFNENGEFDKTYQTVCGTIAI